MFYDQPPAEFENSLMRFLEDSVSRIYQTENVQSYMDWVKSSYTDYIFPEGKESLGFAASMARVIWNATPLPGNRYRPSPLPIPKRNSPCFCGSGKKYKQCCLKFGSGIPPLEKDQIWPIMLEEMGIDDIRDALALHALPMPILLALANDYTEQDMYGDVIDVLEPVFDLPADKMKDYECMALTSLCNAYDEFDLPELRERKLKLLHRLKDHGSSLIRSEAWQRLATILLDQKDTEAAWKAFQNAQRLTPDSVSVDLLEITLLMGQSEFDLAQQRARVIIRKLQRNGESDAEPYMEFLRSVVDNPEKVSEEMFVGQKASNQLERLQHWLELVKDRRLPAFKLDSFPADNDWMKQDQTAPEILEFNKQTSQTDLFEELIEEVLEQEDDVFDNLPEKQHSLILPKSIHTLEQRWERLTNKYEDEPFPWEADEWLDFLEKNPQSFGSPTVISDLLNELENWRPDDWLLKNVSLPLAQRAWKIYESLPEQGAMPWGFLENRPLYRAMHSIVRILNYLGQYDEAMQYAKRLIAINPDDNLGLRGMLFNHYLANKAYDKIFKLLRLYPDDFMLETRMAKILSLWSFGDEVSALEEWRQVKERNPHLKKYMVRSKIQIPEMDTYGVSMGGELEAWLYREAARDIWLAHKGAIGWLKKH